MKDGKTFTYQTRFVLDLGAEKVFDEYANLFNTVERSLYAEVAKGHRSISCKNDFLKKFNITARQFNACRVSLDGKIEACKANQEQALVSLKEQIKALDQKIKIIERKPSKQFILHQKKRRREMLSQRLTHLETAINQNHVKLCFGGKKLFSAQFYLEENGFASHSEWKTAWKAKRNSEFFALGSKDETAGNQTCVASLDINGKFSLRLRLPRALEAKYGKYLTIQNVMFAHGQNEILTALHNQQAISYRFKKDKKSWKIFASTNLQKATIQSIEGNGVIGIDLNADHIACVETDRFGNPIAKKIIPWISYGKTREQLKAITGDICKTIIEYAKETKKPIVVEKLDFCKKKDSLRHENKKFARLLSSFSYSSFFEFLLSRAYKHGIKVHQVNPAFTSVIGRVNYAKRYGLSVHLAAALCIARRYQQFSELPCTPISKIPDGKGGHVAFALPVRNRAKHVWHFWGQVKKKIKAVLAAHYQARNRSLSSA